MRGAPPNLDATELGSTKKPFDGQRSGRKMIDLDNFDEVHAMAERLFGASDRQLMAISMQELKALTKLAMLGGNVIREATAVFALSDMGASRTQIAAAMAELAAVTRPILEQAA